MMQQILAQMAKGEADRKACHEKMAADRKADQEKMTADRKANQEELLARMDKMDAKMANAAKQEEMLAELNAKMDANLAVIKSTINAFKEKMEPNPESTNYLTRYQPNTSQYYGMAACYAQMTTRFTTQLKKCEQKP
jgi:hypothetical protein